MFKDLLTFIAVIFFPIVVFGQTSKYLQLIDSSTKYSALFVGAQPVNDFKLDVNDTTFYYEVLEEDRNCKIDGRILVELIINSKNVDTTYWTDTELKHAILVKSREEYVDIRRAIMKFENLDKEQIKSYRKRINRYNNMNSWDRSITYYSRPVFDNSKQFAAVYSHNGHSGLSGGGSVSVFHYSGEIWQRIGIIKRWNY